ncbi:YcxB family protein [Larkinella soli]|uniref:YcxB family protein n=1 Tax=Larkinella soli TaxID=1770527 RepID=UPI000FFC5C5A|nr:YcxB family protein [Larkinella soli]
MLEITFKFTKSELYKASVAIAQSRFIMRVYRVLGIISVIISLFILSTDLANKDIIAIIFIVCELYLIFVVQIAGRLVANKYIRTKAQITEQITYVFNEKSYQLTGESFFTRMDYNKLYEVKEVRDFILLRVTEGSAHTLPKRAFSEGQYERFKNIIRSVQNLRSTFKE